MATPTHRIILHPGQRLEVEVAGVGAVYSVYVYPEHEYTDANGDVEGVEVDVELNDDVNGTVLDSNTFDLEV